jgi:hypothetical protein
MPSGKESAVDGLSFSASRALALCMAFAISIDPSCTNVAGGKLVKLEIFSLWNLRELLRRAMASVQSLSVKWLRG